MVLIQLFDYIRAITVKISDTGPWLRYTDNFFFLGSWTPHLTSPFQCFVHFRLTAVQKKSLLTFGDSDHPMMVENAS